jgi:hypothetical protein
MNMRAAMCVNKEACNMTGMLHAQIVRNRVGFSQRESVAYQMPAALNLV